jgi:aminocarboxymuconate-semialdehyde decarboxylase
VDTIDVHTHVVPWGLPFGQDDRFACLVPDGDTAQVLVDGAPFRTVDRRSWDMEARLSDMDAQGIRMQVLSVMPELFSYWAEPKIGQTFCTALNDAVAECVAVDPQRFAGLGVVPLQDVDRAIATLEQVDRLGLRGVEVGSNVNGLSTGDAVFLPFFQAAAELDLCVFAHAFHPPYWDCVADPPMSAAVNFPPEIGTCMATAIANGIVEQSPGLRLGASHGGGTLLAHLPRMAAFWSTHDERAARSPSPYASARSLWFDTLVYDPDALETLVRVLGPEHVMVGSDFPFFAEPSGYVLDALERRGEPVPEIRHSNALAFLGLGRENDRTKEDHAR